MNKMVFTGGPSCHQKNLKKPYQMGPLWHGRHQSEADGSQIWSFMDFSKKFAGLLSITATGQNMWHWILFQIPKIAVSMNNAAYTYGTIAILMTSLEVCNFLQYDLKIHHFRQFKCVMSMKCHNRKIEISFSFWDLQTVLYTLSIELLHFVNIDVQYRCKPIEWQKNVHR